MHGYAAQGDTYPEIINQSTFFCQAIIATLPLPHVAMQLE